MKNSIGIKHRKIYIATIFLLIIIILLFYLFNKLDIKKYLVSIYKIEDRTGNIKKAEKKYKDETVVGWIRVQGTNIDYPIVKNFSDGEFLNREFDHAWINSDTDTSANFITIFGHNVRNISKHPIIGDNTMNRFEQLPSFMYYDFNKDNKYIQYTINGKNYLYQIFSVAIVPEYKINYQDNHYTKKEIKNKIEESQTDSYFKYDVKVTDKDKIISLVTCTRFNGINSDSFKIDAKLVENAKRGYNYDVTEKENYQKIKKILEGDGDDV